MGVRRRVRGAGDGMGSDESGDDETRGTLRHAVQNATAGNNMIVIDPTFSGSS
jgi:hypothetical protein